MKRWTVENVFPDVYFPLENGVSIASIAIFVNLRVIILMFTDNHGIAKWPNLGSEFFVTCH